MAESLALFVLGAVLLIAGAEAFIRGLERLPGAASINRSFVAIVLPGFRTAVPVLAVVISATLRGHPEIVLGTIIGAFVANLGFLLSLVILARPIMNGRDRQLMLQFGLMFGSYLLVWFLCGDRVLNQTDGAILLIAQLAVWAYLYIAVKHETAIRISPEVPKSLGFPVLLMIAGLGALMGGAELLVPTASELAHAWGVREWLLGLTLVGAVLSLPGLIAVRRADLDAAFRTVFGGNSMILLLALGIRGVMTDKPLGISDGVLRLEIPLMGLFGLLILPMMLNGFRTHWRDGMVLLAAYAAFVVWQWNR